MSPELPVPSAPQSTPAQPLEIPEPAYGHHRTGKIGQLPKVLRDKLNFLLLDGVPHAQIPNLLGDAAQHINADNISHWATGGYLLWLAEFRQLQQVRVRQEVAMDLACPEGGSRIHEATLQLAATSIAEMVRKLDLSDFQEMLRTEPARFIPFLTALARISDAELKCERHRRQWEAQQAAANSQPTQKAPGLSTETRRTIEKDLNLM